VDLSDESSSRALAPRHDGVETLYSVLQRSSRRGPWRPPETMRLVSVLGSIVLDYREADLPLGVTALDCQVVLGSVEIIVPRDVDLELTGSVLLGSVETRDEADELDASLLGRERLGLPEPGPQEEYERPVLSVHCSGVLGSVEIELA
jgi:hypothetical protein